MNMKNANLMNEYVTLLVGDDSKYQEIALLVDRTDFLEAIEMLRETLGIKAPLVNVYDNFSTLFADGWKKEYQKWVADNSSKNKQLISEIKQLLFKLKKPQYLLDTALQTVFFKAVIDYSGLVKIVGKDSSFNDTTIGIFPTLYTTKDEMNEAWERVQELFKTLPGSFCPTNERKNSKAEFRRNRDWYWRNLSGESYTEIALSLASKNVQTDFKKRKREKIDNVGRDELLYLSEVRQALRRYKNTLKNNTDIQVSSTY